MAIYGVTFVKVDGTNRFVFHTRVEEPLWILQLSTMGECQSHSVLEHLSNANYSVMRPDRNPHRVAWLLPLDFFDQGGIGSLD